MTAGQCPKNRIEHGLQVEGGTARGDNERSGDRNELCGHGADHDHAQDRKALGEGLHLTRCHSLGNKASAQLHAQAATEPVDDLVGHVVDKGEQDGAEPRTLLRETNGNAGCDNTQVGKLDGVADTGNRAHEGNLDGLNGVVIKLLAGIEGGLALVLHRNDDGVDE